MVYWMKKRKQTKLENFCAAPLSWDGILMMWPWPCALACFVPVNPGLAMLHCTDRESPAKHGTAKGAAKIGTAILPHLVSLIPGCANLLFSAVAFHGNGMVAVGFLFVFYIFFEKDFDLFFGHFHFLASLLLNLLVILFMHIMLNIFPIILKTNFLPEFSKLWICDSFWINNS